MGRMLALDSPVPALSATGGGPADKVKSVVANTPLVEAAVTQHGGAAP
jgi:hypothetical protein